MPELLFELFSEEIPARMQRRAAEDLKSLVTNALVEADLLYEGAQAHATPRRLVLSVEGLPAKTADSTDERKGPRVDAPKPAIEGFLKSTGLKLGDLTVQEDKKGKFYIAAIAKPGRPAPEVIAGILPDIVRKFPWPRSMRWGSGPLRWVRPLQSILCTFDGEVVPLKVGGIASGNVTRGHRFLAPGEITVRRFEDYAQKLHDAKVIVSSTQRAETIRIEAKNLAFAQGLDLIEDEALLEETAGLVEWPVVLMGAFDQKYLEMPPEVIVTTIKTHQKCFALHRASGDPSRLAPLAPQDEGGGGGGAEGAEEGREPSSSPHPEVRAERASKGGGLSNRYILVSNMIARDGGKEIVHGNDKVIAARLSDAKFFWDHDRKTPLAELLPKLDHITFHAKLGSQGERVKRIEALAGEIAKTIGADVEKAKLAARLSKADLVTGMVGEFPELQGLMGRYYALEQGLDAEVADAIRDHYKPQGPSDSIPVSKVGQAVALADKLDTLVGFWAIDEKPTGSKDPYALRRAAIGFIKTVMLSNNKMRLTALVTFSQREFQKTQLAEALRTEFSEIELLYPVDVNGEKQLRPFNFPFSQGDPYSWVVESAENNGFFDTGFTLTLIRGIGRTKIQPWGVPQASQHAVYDEESVKVEILPPDRLLVPDLLSFFADRLKVYLREQGKRHDLIDAVFALGGQDDLLMIVKRVEALSKFLDTDDGKNLLVGVKRATNILKIEEKKDGRLYDTNVERHRLIKAEELVLNSMITVATGQAHAAIEHEDFEGAMRAIAKLRTPVDQFFDKVTVNDRDPGFRENRLKLLNRIRAATLEVADFTKIEG